MNDIKCFPIGCFYTEETDVPRHWSVSESEGVIVLDEKYEKGISDYSAGDKIFVIFVFHKSPAFTDENLRTTPPHKDKEFGVFSICSPVRPNPIGLSVLEIMRIEKNKIYVRNTDMHNGTPVLDIKPFIK